MICAQCTAEVPEADRFCEECGLPVVAAPVAGAEPAGCKCGAAPEQIDEDGFCSACGVRRDFPARDHFEIATSPRFAAVSDKGLRHHRNEDFVAMEEAGGYTALVVCDGVSSTRDPDKASEAAAQAALRALMQGAAAGTPSMRAALGAAQDAASAVGRVNGVAKNGVSKSDDSPASTIVAAAVHDGAATIGWLGDSRAYWIGAGSCMQLSEDHSWLTEAVASGKFTEAEAARNGNAHAITRWLGADAPDEPEAPVIRFEIKEPGWLLLCTDGLWNYAPDPGSIGELVNSSGAEALEIARNLIGFAKAQGGHDNITAALLRFETPPFNDPI